MKQAIIAASLAFALAVLSPQTAQAQGTIYVSSLGLPSTGSISVGSDFWLAEPFWTGTNAGGYLLNSVQLALTNASGNPSGFTVMIYNRNPNIVAGTLPGSSLGTLNGPLDPVTAGIYTYSPASSLALSPSTLYYFVLTAGTAVADGAYQWSLAGTQIPTWSGKWESNGFPLYCTDGSNWGLSLQNSTQFAISATLIPEPSAAGLLALGGFLLVWRRRKVKAVNARFFTPP